MRVSWLLDVDRGRYRWATGDQDVELNGATFRHAGDLENIQLPAHALGVRELSLSFRIAVADAGLLAVLVQGLDAVPVAVRLVRAPAGTSAWQLVPYSFAGTLSQSVVLDGIWHADIRRRRRNNLALQAEWSHEAQQALYPGDGGLGSMAALERGVRLRWPPG